jgi:hypothetical protein
MQSTLYSLFRILRTILSSNECRACKIAIFAFDVCTGSKWSNTDKLGPQCSPIAYRRNAQKTSFPHVSLSCCCWDDLCRCRAGRTHSLRRASTIWDTGTSCRNPTLPTHSRGHWTLCLIPKRWHRSPVIGSYTAFPCIYWTDTVKGLDIRREMSTCPTDRSGIADKMLGRPIPFAAPMRIRRERWIRNQFEHYSVVCISVWRHDSRLRWHPHGRIRFPGAFHIVSHQSRLSHYDFNQFRTILVWGFTWLNTDGCAPYTPWYWRNCWCLNDHNRYDVLSESTKIVWDPFVDVYSISAKLPKASDIWAISFARID